jgi:hypothetical protein
MAKQNQFCQTSSILDSCFALPDFGTEIAFLTGFGSTRVVVLDKTKLRRQRKRGIYHLGAQKQGPNVNSEKRKKKLILYFYF